MIARVLLDEEIPSSSEYVFWVVVEMVFLMFIVYGVLRKFTEHTYGTLVNRSTFWIAYSVYYCAFSTVILLPLDIAEALSKEGNTQMWAVIWRVFFWTFQAFSMVIIPIQRDFSSSGEFQFKRRLGRAIKKNVRNYIIAVVLIAAFLIYMIATDELTFGGIFGFIAAITNTIGLVILVLLMGYGLVEVPRSMWLSANTDRKLREYYWRAADRRVALDDARLELLDALQVLHKLQRTVLHSDPLRPFVDQMVAEVDVYRRSVLEWPSPGDIGATGETGGSGESSVSDDLELGRALRNVQSSARTGRTASGNGAAGNSGSRGGILGSVWKKFTLWRDSDDIDEADAAALDRNRHLRSSIADEGSSGSGELLDGPTSEERYEQLVSIHTRFKKTLIQYGKAERQWHYLQKKAADMEDVVRNKRESGGQAKRHRFQHSPPKVYEYCEDTRSCCEYYWKCVFRSFVRRGVALCCAALSVCIIWTECIIIFSNPKLSVVHELIVSIGVDDILTLQFVSLVPLLYMAFCAYNTIFKLRILSIYELLPGYADGVSLMFSSLFLVRVTMPLCYNFLFLARESKFTTSIPSCSTGDECITGFTKLMGKMTVVPFFGKQFNTIFPLLVGLFTLFTLLNVYSRIMRCLGFRRVQLLDHFDDDQQVSEGAILLQRAREQYSLRQDGSGRDSHVTSTILEQERRRQDNLSPTSQTKKSARMDSLREKYNMSSGTSSAPPPSAEASSEADSRYFPHRSTAVPLAGLSTTTFGGQQRLDDSGDISSGTFGNAAGGVESLGFKKFSWRDKK